MEHLINKEGVNRSAEKEAGDQPCLNTDRELWRERHGDYYADSIHVTEHGGIGINCGGLVYVKPLRAWHELAKHAQSLEEKEAGGRNVGKGQMALKAPREVCILDCDSPCFPPSDYERKQCGCRTCRANLYPALATAISLMRTCYNAANAIANNCSDAFTKGVMQRLYEAANYAKHGLADSVESAGLAHTDSVFRHLKTNPDSSGGGSDGGAEFGEPRGVAANTVPGQAELPLAGIEEQRYPVTTRYAVWINNWLVCGTDRRYIAEMIARAINVWGQSEDGKQWYRQIIEAPSVLVGRESSDASSSQNPDSSHAPESSRDSSSPKTAGVLDNGGNA